VRKGERSTFFLLITTLRKDNVTISRTWYAYMYSIFAKNDVIKSDDRILSHFKRDLVISRSATVKCASGRSIPRGAQKSLGFGRPCRRAKSTYNEGGFARSTKIRWNFNISRRRERAECNPLDKRVPPPWCLLTNRGHRFRAKLCRRGRTMSTRRKRVSQSLNESSRYVTHAKERTKEKGHALFERDREKRPSCWIVSKKFCFVSPKQIVRVRCAERTSLSFPRFRHNCGNRGRLAPGRDQPVQLLFVVVTVTSWSWKNMGAIHR